MYDNPQKIIIAGGGTAGLVTALILLKRYPTLDLTMLIPKELGIIGVGEGSTEHWEDFTEYMGWKKEEFIIGTKATIKTGIMYRGWNPKWDFLHSVNTAWTEQLGLLGIFYYESMIEGIDPKAFCPRNFWESSVENSFIKETQRPAVCDGIRQFHFNTFSLNEYLTKKAKELGAKIIDDKVKGVKTDLKGISELIGDKGKYKADFYIDSTGFRRVLLSALDGKWVSWRKWLVAKEAIAFPTEDKDEYPMWTESMAMNAGWKWRIPTYGRFGNGYIYDSNYIDKDKAVQECEEIFGHKIEVAKHIKFDPGKVDKSWIKNCVSVGLSNNFIEPLEATSITSSIQQSFILVHRLFNYNQHTIDQYNKDVDCILENMKDFVSMRYISKGKGTKFWKELPHNFEIPDNIKHFMEIWKTRLVDQLDMTGLYNHYCMFSQNNYNLCAYGQGLINGPDLKKYYNKTAFPPELLEQYYTNEGKCFTVLDKQSRRLGSLPHKKYIQELHRVGAHEKVRFPLDGDEITLDWPRPSFMNNYVGGLTN